MLTFYTFPPSMNCRKVQAVINYLDLKVETRIVDLGAGKTREQEYLALNPNGRLPALADGDFILWESGAICQYLAEAHGDNRLWASDPRTRADITRWTCWQLAHWQPAAGTLVWEYVAKPYFGAGEPDPAQVEKGIEQFHVVAGVLDRHLAGRRFIVGDRVTLADFAVGCALMYTKEARLPLEPYPNIREWSGRLDEVKGWKASAG